MVEVVCCPKCRRKSRVPDTLIGKRVKCPGCAEIFTAATAAPPPAKEDAEGEKEQDKEEVISFQVLDDAKAKRRRGNDEDADEDRPRRSRRLRDDDDDDEERPSRRTTRRKRKIRRTTSGISSVLGELDTPKLILLGVVGVCILSTLLALVFPGFALIPGIVGLLTIVGGGL
jgi:hypothetical protein